MKVHIYTRMKKVTVVERRPSIIGTHSTYVGQLECGHGFARVCKWVRGKNRYIPGEPKRLRCRECERIRAEAAQ